MTPGRSFSAVCRNESANRWIETARKAALTCGTSTKLSEGRNEPPPTSPNIADAMLGEAQLGAENAQVDGELIYPERIKLPAAAQGSFQPVQRQA